MAVNTCEYCRGRGITGWIPRWEWILDSIWGTIWEKFVIEDCNYCGGDGISKPPGWPDKKGMYNHRPPRPVGSHERYYDQPGS